MREKAPSSATCSAHHEGPPLAIMVNEASASVIEADHVLKRDGEFRTLGNGSVVRAADDEYSTALALLQHRQPHAARVFLEAAGTVRLRGTAGYGYMPGYRPDGIVVVVNAETIRERAEAPEDGARLMGSSPAPTSSSSTRSIGSPRPPARRCRNGSRPPTPGCASSSARTVACRASCSLGWGQTTRCVTCAS